MTSIYICLLYVVIVSGLEGDRCITCERDRLEECVSGKDAAQIDGHTQQCSSSLPFCEVTIQERLGPEPDSEPELVDVTRGCVRNSTFECTDNSNIRTCTATCQGDLCNDFEDAAARVAAYEQEQAEKKQADAAPSQMTPVEAGPSTSVIQMTPVGTGPSTGVIVVSVLVPLAVIVAVTVGVWRFCARRT